MLCGDRMRDRRLGRPGRRFCDYKQPPIEVPLIITGMAFGFSLGVAFCTIAANMGWW